MKKYFSILSLIITCFLTLESFARPPILVSIIPIDPQCIGVDDGKITISATGTGALSYSIDNGSNFQSGNVFTGLAPGTYDVVVQDGTGTVTQQIILTYQSVVTAAFTPSVSSGIAVLAVNFVNNSIGAVSYDWNLDGGNMNSTMVNPAFSYDTPGNYTVTLIASNNSCRDTATSVITVTGVSQMDPIANVFSPNGDGQNDNFLIATIGMKTMEVFIYNRYGEIVYEWLGKNGYWDGYTYPAGQAVPDGVYFYYVKAVGFDGVEYDRNGQLTLLR